MITIDDNKPKNEKMNRLYYFIPLFAAVAAKVTFPFILSLNNLQNNTYRNITYPNNTYRKNTYPKNTYPKNV